MLLMILSGIKTDLFFGAGMVSFHRLKLWIYLLLSSSLTLDIILVEYTTVLIFNYVLYSRRRAPQQAVGSFIIDYFALTGEPM